MSGLLLGTPLRVGPMRLRNRIVLPAHLTNLSEDRRPGPRLRAYYEARAAGGTALVVTEEWAVDPADRPHRNGLDGSDPAAVAALGPLVAALRGHDTRLVAQIGHAGPQSSGLHTGRPVIGPSPVADPAFREVPRVAAAADLEAVVGRFASTASRLAAVGVDGVELQCSQSSLLRAFLSPLTNRRTDEWGGDLAGRSRLLLAVLHAVRAAVGAGVAVGVRLCVDEAAPGGLDLDAAVAVAQLLATGGAVDYLSAAPGLSTSTMHRVAPSMSAPDGDDLAAAAALRAAGLVVIGTGRMILPEQAEEALRSGSCDLVGAVRAQIADPAFAAKALAGRRVRRCTGCNQGCVGVPSRGAPTTCQVNPTVVPIPSPPPARRRRVLVVGAGPAGLAASVAAARRGHAVTLVERADRPGGRLLLAAVGPGRSRLVHLVEDLVADAADLGVDLRLGTACDPAAWLTPGHDVVVVATGAEAIRPAWAGADPTVLDVTDVLADPTLVRPGARVVVVDGTGTHRATSAALTAAAAGAAVTVVTDALAVGDRLGSTLDQEQWWHEVARLGIAERPALVVEAREAGLLRTTHHLSGEDVLLPADQVILALHDRPADQFWLQLSQGSSLGSSSGEPQSGGPQAGGSQSGWPPSGGSQSGWPPSGGSQSGWPPSGGSQVSQGPPFSQGVERHRVGDCVAPRDALAAVADGDRIGGAL